MTLVLRCGVVAVAAALLVGCDVVRPTTHCAPVIAKRTESTVTYPHALVLNREAHEGLGDNGAFSGVLPWTAEDTGVDAPESTVFAWYTHWLSTHGWTHVRDQHPTDSNGVKVSDESDWERGDESFSVMVDVSAEGRSPFSLTPDQLLVSTTYSAPGRVLGCD